MASVGKQRVLAYVWDRPRGHKLIKKKDYFLIILIKKSNDERGIHCQFFTSSPNSSKTDFLSFCHHQKLQAENSQITVCKSLPNWWSVLRCLFLMSWNPEIELSSSLLSRESQFKIAIWKNFLLTAWLSTNILISVKIVGEDLYSTTFKSLWPADTFHTQLLIFLTIFLISKNLNPPPYQK